jgi:hypothetical protein
MRLISKRMAFGVSSVAFTSVPSHNFGVRIDRCRWLRRASQCTRPGRGHRLDFALWKPRRSACRFAYRGRAQRRCACAGRPDRARECRSGSAATGRASGCRSENRAPRGGRGDTLDAIQRQKLAALELANAQAREPDLKFDDDSFKRAFWAAGQMWRAETLCKSRYFVSFVDDGIRTVEDTPPEQHQRDSLSRGRHRPRRYFLATGTRRSAW